MKMLDSCLAIRLRLVPDECKFPEHSIFGELEGAVGYGTTTREKLPQSLFFQLI